MIRKKTIIIGLLVFALGIVAFVLGVNIQRQKVVSQIKTTINNCVKGSIDSSKMNEAAGEKISDYIKDTCEEDGELIIDSSSCEVTEIDWKKKYVWLEIEYSGTTEEKKKISGNEYIKVFFKEKNSGVFITKIGISVGETGISDLD